MIPSEVNAPQISLKYWLEYIGLRLAGGILGILPVEWASAFSGQLWRLFARFSLRHKRALFNLQRAYPDLTDQQRLKIAFDMWENLGRIFAEAFHLPTIIEAGRIHIENPETFERLKADGTGAIFCSAHLGNWEFAIYPLYFYQLNPASIYQKIKNPLIEHYILQLRGFLYPGGLYPKSKTAVRQLQQHLKAGGCIAILTDLRDFTGINVDFFGLDAPSTPFPAHMALSMNLPLYFGIVQRLPRVQFTLRLEKIEVARTGDRRADVHATTAAVHSVIETAIRAHPEQWMWGNRRWG